VAPASGFSPATLPGLAGWWKDSVVQADNTDVTTWPDSSGNARDMGQGTGSNKPKLRTAFRNGRSVMSFDGAQGFGRASFPLSGALTVFWAGQITTATNYGMMVAFGGAGSGAWYVGQIATSGRVIMAWGTDNAGPSSAGSVAGAWHVLTAKWVSAGDLFLWVDGAATGTSVARGPLPVAADYLGICQRSDGLRVNGYTGEVILCNSDLSATDRQATEAYLRTGWATP